MDIILEKLREIVHKSHVSDTKYLTFAYSQNVDPILEGIPDYVAIPKSAQEISEILKLANEKNIPVYPRGGGCCEFGGSKPIGDGGIVLDLKQMDKIINLDEDHLIVTVESGISWAQLDEYLSPFGLYTGCMGPGSGMTASIGGGISHHSVGGGGGAKYGACTKQLISLEVVLPTGEIINTGSQANRFSKIPFGRFGNGPDLSGLFCGDNGILGIKTKVSLQVFPRPKFVECKTFQLKGNTARSAAKIMIEIRRRGIDVYDAMYIPDIVVSVFKSEKVILPWIENKIRRGLFFYTIEAYSQEELNEKVKQLDQIFEENKAKILGPEISDGNIARWHYKEQGHWQLYHPLWGLTPTSEPCTTECFVPIQQFPSLLEAIEQWEYEHTPEMDKIFEVTKVRPIVGSGPILLLGENSVEVTCGFTTYPHKDIREINLSLWKSMIDLVTKMGAQWYMMGDICSREFVEIGAFTPEYYSLLTNMKRILDPKNILSRGKFKLLEVEK